MPGKKNILSGHHSNYLAPLNYKWWPPSDISSDHQIRYLFFGMTPTSFCTLPLWSKIKIVCDSFILCVFYRCFFFTADTFKKISVIHTNIDDDGDTLRNEFVNYLTQLIAAMTDKREQEELSIMNNR